GACRSGDMSSPVSNMNFPPTQEQASGYPQPFHEFLADISCLGVSPSRAGMRYAVLGARSNLRWWLLPLDHGGACARSGFDMFQPVSRMARVAKAGLRF